MGSKKWKRCMALGILLLMTLCSVGAGSKPEIDTSEGAKEEQQLQLGVPQVVVPVEFFNRDDDFYVQCLQNQSQGNSITYADGYYYFRSQTKNYSLCRTKGQGMPVEEVVDQIPGAIYVRKDQVYFINVSDNRTLYCVGTDGSSLRKLSDFPMQELIVVGDKIYFRSVYEREYDPFYQLTEEAAENDRYLYSMNLDGSGCELLIPQVCLEVTTNGESLYYLVEDNEEGDWVFTVYKSGMDGKDQEIFFQSKSWLWSLTLYKGTLYCVDSEENQLICIEEQEAKEIASDVWFFSISEGQAYVNNKEEIRRVDLETGEEELLIREDSRWGNNVQNREDTYPWFAGSYNRGIFLVNGQIFVRYFESEKKGVLWHLWDGEKFVVFEDMEPLDAEDLVLDTSLLYELNFYDPGREDEGAKEYLDMDGEICYDEAYGVREDGTTYGNFSITLPKFNSGLTCCDQMNRQMDSLFALAMEDKESFFEKAKEQGGQDDCINWYRQHGYSNLYIGETYISMHYFRGGYDGGMRVWRESLPLLFDRETGLMIHMEDLFTVEENEYMKRLTGAVYKYCEMTGMDWWNEAFDNNVLVKNFRDLSCYLTPDGIVLCYDRYAVQAGASGNPTFEIPYEWFEDIFRH